jgi:hypothetical protein
MRDGKISVWEAAFNSEPIDAIPWAALFDK